MRIAHLQEYPRYLPVLADLCGGEWAHLYAGWNHTNALEEFSATRLDGQLPITLIALEGEELLGTVSLILHDLPGREDLSPWLASLIVLPERRGKQVATFLVSEAEKILQKLEIPAAYLFTETANGLFGRLGWQVFDQADANGHIVTIFQKTFGKRTSQR